MSGSILKKIYTSSMIYALANSIEALAPFIIAVILTRKLSPDEYGLWVLFIALFTFIRPVISLSIQDAMKMHYFEMDRNMLAELILSAFFLMSTVTLMFTTLAYLGRDYLSSWLKFPSQWIVSIIATAYLYSIFYFLLSLNQFEGNKIRFIMLHIIQTTFGIGITTALVLTGWEWKGAIIGKIAGLLVVFLLGVIWLPKDLQFSISTKIFLQAKKLTKFGLHYLPTGLSIVIIPLTDRLVISHMLGLSENGFYGAAALFGSAFFVVVNGFLLAWMPWLFRKLMQQDKNYRMEIRSVSLSFILLLPIIAICFYWLCTFAAPYIIGESFDDSFVYIPWVISAFVMQGYFFHNQAFLLHRQAVVIMSVSSTLCILLNIILSYSWSLTHGVQGVIFATIVSYALSALLSGFFSFRIYRDLTITRHSYV